MQRASDVHSIEDTHPAFARILSEITPDEARILRYLYLEGPQPAIDVRTNRPLGIGSELVEGGLSMIAEHAGCRYLDRISQYLTNLSRLGLIEFSKEQVSNPQRYQVIEAQPKVVEALKRAGRMPKMVQRSIHLNSFGDGLLPHLPARSTPRRPPRSARGPARPDRPAILANGSAGGTIGRWSRRRRRTRGRCDGACSSVWRRPCSSCSAAGRCSRS